MTMNVNFYMLLFLVFLTLKLVGTIAWSWWWVTAPLWLPFTIVLTLYLLLIVTTTVIGLFYKG